MDPDNSMETEETTVEYDPADIAREFVEQVLAAMELPAEVSSETLEDGSLRVEVTGEQAGDVIGAYGEGLNALQYLAGLVVQRYTGDHTRLLLDADGYREKRQASLEQQARELAAAVVDAGQEAELDPLNAFERRIIHHALLDYPGVVTYSEGEGEERRVIIAPKPDKQ